MPINVICSNCKTALRLPDELAGRVIECPACKFKLEVPGGGVQPSVMRMGGGSMNPRMDRVLGQRVPLFLDILGLHVRWSADSPNRDIFRFVWSLRHLAMIVLALALWIYSAGDPGRAGAMAAWFFCIGVLTFLAAWIQMSRVSRSLAANIAGRRGQGLLSNAVSNLLLVSTDLRAVLPGMRTVLLACVLMLAGMCLAVESGDLLNVLPIPSFSKSQVSNRPYNPKVPEVKESATPTQTTTTKPKAGPSPEDLPLPPPPEE